MFFTPSIPPMDQELGLYTGAVRGLHQAGSSEARDYVAECAKFRDLEAAEDHEYRSMVRLLVAGVSAVVDTQPGSREATPSSREAATPSAREAMSAEDADVSREDADVPRAVLVEESVGSPVASVYIPVDPPRKGPPPLEIHHRLCLEMERWPRRRDIEAGRAALELITVRSAVLDSAIVRLHEAEAILRACDQRLRELAANLERLVGSHQLLNGNWCFVFDRERADSRRYKTRLLTIVVFIVCTLAAYVAAPDSYMFGLVGFCLGLGALAAEWVVRRTSGARVFGCAPMAEFLEAPTVNVWSQRDLRVAEVCSRYSCAAW